MRAHHWGTVAGAAAAQAGLDRALGAGQAGADRVPGLGLLYRHVHELVSSLSAYHTYVSTA